MTRHVVYQRKRVGRFTGNPNVSELTRTTPKMFMVRGCFVEGHMRKADHAYRVFDTKEEAETWIDSFKETDDAKAAFKDLTAAREVQTQAAMDLARAYDTLGKAMWGDQDDG